MCRQNPWFNTNLPDYLRPLPQTEEELHQSVDEAIVDELHKVFDTYDKGMYGVEKKGLTERGHLL